MTRTSMARSAEDLELSLLQLLRLKGRLKSDDLAGSLDHVKDECNQLLEAAVGAGNCVCKGATARLTPQGRERLDELLGAERSKLDQRKLQVLYDEFDDHNTRFKEIITSWQVRENDVPNDHSDQDYDLGVLAELAALHGRFSDLLERIVGSAPRLVHYPPRFAGALQRVQAGEHQYVARPIMDSYHTVWFELHEELIGLLGRTRAEEASAGRAV